MLMRCGREQVLFIETPRKALEAHQWVGERRAPVAVSLIQVSTWLVRLTVDLFDEPRRVDGRVEIGIDAEDVSALHVCSRGAVQLGQSTIARRLPVDSEHDIVVCDMIVSSPLGLAARFPATQLLAFEGEEGFLQPKDARVDPRNTTLSSTL